MNCAILPTKKLGLASVNEKRDNESSNICYLLLLLEKLMVNLILDVEKVL